jgi:hypothetical protein
VVIDPVRTETAGRRHAHHFIRPGTDAGVPHRARERAARSWVRRRSNATVTKLAGSTPRSAALRPFGIEGRGRVHRLSLPADVRAIAARAARGSPSAVAYGAWACRRSLRVGVHVAHPAREQSITGNLDAVGRRDCAPQPAGADDRPGHASRSLGKYRTRVSGRPIFGQRIPRRSR